VRAGFVVCLAAPGRHAAPDWRPLLDLLHAAGLAMQPASRGRRSWKNGS
jgi:hypothetical protein